MIAKKNSGYDLEGKRKAFFTLGLLVTGSLTLAAFTYSDPILEIDSGNDVDRQPVAFNYEIEDPKDKDDDKQLDVKTQDDTQNKTAMIDIQPNLGELIKKSVNSNLLPTSGVTIDLGGMPSGPVTSRGTKTIIDPPVEEWVDVDAQFVGGSIEMKKYIHAEIVYPEISRYAGEQGTVYITFVVETDGEITNIEVVQGVSKNLDREAKRVVRSFPKWIPGEKDAKKVRTRVRLPIVFVLD